MIPLLDLLFVILPLSAVGSVALSLGKVSSSFLWRRTLNQHHRHAKGRQSTPTEPPEIAAFISKEKIRKESMDTKLDLRQLSD